MKAGLALGGNLGETTTLMRDALSELGVTAETDVLAMSSFYTTAPIGAEAGDRFVNAAALIETEFSPLSLLKTALRLEHQAGRERKIHWGPRTLDIDLIFYGEEILDQEGLIVPHPACWFRQFVLKPLCEIAGELVHPIFGVPFSELEQRLEHRPLVIDANELPRNRQRALREKIREAIPAAPVTWEETPDATFVLHEGNCRERGSMGVGDLFEGDLPGMFEHELPDVLRAALDEPRVVSA